ncbi:MAG TPA: penicillin-binding protein 2 [Acidimicrobiales bacterium]|nr:penicillin-binding protein 2 [Acidimicrobiales bacterium]
MTSADHPSPQFRLTILIVVVACLFGALFARLWFLQVINAPRAQAVAADNGVRTIYTPAPRGLILDRNGKVLVGNVNEPVIEVNRQVAAQNPQMVTRLAPLLGKTVSQLRAAIENLQYSPYAPVPVAPDATPEQILYIQENQSMFPGVRATTMSVRNYSQMGLAAANIEGYVGQISSAELAKLKSDGYQAGDQIGLSGVEAEYESYLRGTPGIQKVQVDSKGNVLGTLSSTPPVPGDNLRLTIDGAIQVVAQRAIAQGQAAAQHTFDPVTRRDYTAPAGSAVVEDPGTGEILALATNPSYNPGLFVGGISQHNYSALLNNPTDPLVDRSIQGQYAPGSTFKLVTAMAGLQYGIITPTSWFDDTGSIQVGNFTAHNDNGEAYGPIQLPQAITVSSDNYFNTIGLDLWYGRKQYGDDALQKVAAQFGLGKPTGIDLPNEAAGKIPTPQSYLQDHQANPKVFQQAQWYPGNSDQMAIGQDEDLVTPLQLANAYSCFANGGSLYQPTLVKDAETPSGKVVKTFGAKVVHTVAIQPAWRAALIQGFEGVTHAAKGTASTVFAGTPLAAPQYDIAGKTGTAQVNPPRQDTSVFTSFSPAAAPRYVVDAFMEQAGYGSSVAAPVVREIYAALYGLPPEPVTYSAAGAGGQN